MYLTRLGVHVECEGLVFGAFPSRSVRKGIGFLTSGRPVQEEDVLWCTSLSHHYFGAVAKLDADETWCTATAHATSAATPTSPSLTCFSASCQHCHRNDVFFFRYST
jgi:hypothetical protein